MPTESGAADLMGALICLLAIGAVVVLGMLLVRSRRSGSGGWQAPAASEVPLAELGNRANAQLIEADNALKTSEQELGFASAQYGQEATKAFNDALTAAKAQVAEAFRVRQRLDDGVPEDEPTQRKWLQEIIDRCAAASRDLDAQAESFARLRAMESQVEQLAAGLGSRLGDIQARLPGARETLSGLTGRYAESALVAVVRNVDDAGDRVDFASRELQRASEAVSRGDRAAAALAVRGAEQALGQAGVLLDALDKTRTDLDGALTAVKALLDETQAEVAAGQAALNAGRGSTGGADQVSLAAEVARAEQVLSSVRAELAGARPDPLGAMQRVQAVSGSLGGALNAIRDAAAQAQHARAVLDQAIFGARSTVDSAVDFITTRRGAVGSEARTRLAEAQRHLDQAIATSAGDPVGALASAQRAQSLAEQAVQAARNDVSQWGAPSGGYGGGGPVIITGGGGGMGGLGGAILGGILIDGMLGGGRMGGGMGGRGGMRGGMGGRGYRRGSGVRLGLMSTSGDESAQAGDVSDGEEPVGIPGRFGGLATRVSDTAASLH